MTILSSAMLGILEEAGESILILTEGLEPEQFFDSRITQQEALRQMTVMAGIAVKVPDDIKQKMIEIDWTGWSLLSVQLAMADGSAREALWFGVRSLVPATLMWLRVFRKSAPELFSPIP
ncbi:MAG: hypothetical protein WA123_03075 [Methylotenera sp.]